VPEEEFYRAVFGVKPAEVLLRADTIGTLLARPDIRQRVGESGLTYLILVGGGTHYSGGSSGFVGAGGFGAAIVAGVTEKTRSTHLTASIFELASGREALVQRRGRPRGRDDPPSPRLGLGSPYRIPSLRGAGFRGRASDPWEAHAGVTAAALDRAGTNATSSRNENWLRRDSLLKSG
jgi:hypothetical protein